MRNGVAFFGSRGPVQVVEEPCRRLDWTFRIAASPAEVTRTGPRAAEKHPVQLDFAARELTVKLVYYGPALSGKTSNLQALHAATDPTSTGRLMTLETKDDRTLFFDLLPLTFKGKGDLSVRLKVFTVPGSRRSGVHR
jgi:hypothetical protein